jgi:hypothetical protein
MTQHSNRGARDAETLSSAKEKTLRKKDSLLINGGCHRDGSFWWTVASGIIGRVSQALPTLAYEIS